MRDGLRIRPCRRSVCEDLVVDEKSGACPPTAVPVLPLDYEIDYGSAARVREEIAAAFVPGMRALIVDLTRCTFADTAAVAELVAANKLCLASDALLAVIIPAALTRLFAIMALDQYLAVFPSLQAALEAIGEP
jgi:anti-anti-sigma factor